MATWVDYTGSKEQLEKLANAKTAVRVRYANGQEVNWAYTLFKSEASAKAILETATAYLISEPHPYADLIEVWARTGCEVWVKIKLTNGMIPNWLINNLLVVEVSLDRNYVVIKTTRPNWHLLSAEYRLTPFED